MEYGVLAITPSLMLFTAVWLAAVCARERDRVSKKSARDNCLVSDSIWTSRDVLITDSLAEFLWIPLSSSIASAEQLIYESSLCASMQLKQKW